MNVDFFWWGISSKKIIVCKYILFIYILSHLIKKFVVIDICVNVFLIEKHNETKEFSSLIWLKVALLLIWDSKGMLTTHIFNYNNFVITEHFNNSFVRSTGPCPIIRMGKQHELLSDLTKAASLLIIRARTRI